MQINETELNEFGVRFLPRNRRHLVCVTLLTQALSQHIVFVGYTTTPPLHTGTPQLSRSILLTFKNVRKHRASTLSFTPFIPASYRRFSNRLD